MRSDRKERFQGLVDDALAALETARAEDAVAEKEGQKYGCLTALGCALSFLSCFYGFFVVLVGVASVLEGRFSRPEVGWSLAVLAWVSVLVFATWRLGKKASYFKGRDLDNGKLNCVVGVLKDLQVDLNPGKPVDLEMDFCQGLEQLTADTPNPGQPMPWFTARMSLEDGTRVGLKVSRMFKRKIRRKRRYTKIRGRAWDIIDIQLRGGDVSLGALWEQLQPPLGLRLHSHSLQEGTGSAWLRFVTAPATIAYDRSQRFFESERLASSQQVVAALVLAYTGLHGKRKSEMDFPPVS